MFATTRALPLCPACKQALHYTAELDLIECSPGAGLCPTMEAATGDDGDTDLDDAVLDPCRDAFIAFLHQLNGGMIA
jgi:hypothetical protein